MYLFKSLEINLVKFKFKINILIIYLLQLLFNYIIAYLHFKKEVNLNYVNIIILSSNEPLLVLA